MAETGDEDWELKEGLPFPHFGLVALAAGNEGFGTYCESGVGEIWDEGEKLLLLLDGVGCCDITGK